MLKAKDIYPEAAEDGWFSFCDYTPILDSLGDILLQVDDDDYPGDSRVLYKGHGGQVGFLRFGWGSCSGCDQLQSCDNYEEVDELITFLNDSIKWFPSPAEALDWFNTHDWGGDYDWHMEETREFVSKAKKLLEQMIEESKEK